ncbi:MAG TPA: aminotransferase class I/II-fold pyridoxal phosphate-dependent enzyme [bacterium]|nr:aminotransferase class I/II-fold pyridoxal phosphate-dependent enzyme [bacterium]
MEFPRLERLPPYVLAEVAIGMQRARREGSDIINLGMGNPDIPTPPHIVAKLAEAAAKPANHRYSLSRGIPKLREAICELYGRRWEVELDSEKEAIVTLGCKEGLSHLVLAATVPGDVVLAPNPTYPIHSYSVVIAGADVRGVRIGPGHDFFENLSRAMKTIWPRPKLLIASFPSNPTAQAVDLPFFEKLVDFAKETGVRIVHDLAYADICFDGYRAPSILQVKGAKDVAVEFYSMSKGYSMPGWRVGFCVGNSELVAALGKIKSYLDYGMFQPIQIAATVALRFGDEDVKEICEIYRRRRDALCDGLSRIGWEVERPRATMFVWAKIPGRFEAEGSAAFSRRMLSDAGVAASPGIGFGEYGEGFVRFALVENEERIKQAVRGIRGMLER